MTSIHIKQLSKAIDDKSTGAIIECNGKKQKVLFNRVKVGYGEKVFFTCLICGKNKERLYLEGNLFRCSDCCFVNPYKGIQNTTKGGYDYIAYKMQRFAIKCGIGRFDFPFDYSKHPKPKGKHKDKWEKNLAIMQCLENMRFQSIIYNKMWNPITIRSVEQGKNKYLSYPLFELKQYLFAIDSGVLKR